MLWTEGSFTWLVKYSRHGEKIVFNVSPAIQLRTLVHYPPREHYHQALRITRSAAWESILHAFSDYKHGQRESLLPNPVIF